MSNRIPRLKQYKLVDAQTIDSTDFFTPATDGRNLEILRYVISWENGVSPDIDIQIQSPYGLAISEDSIGSKIDSHLLWATYDVATVNPNISGASGNHVIDVALFPNRFVRLKFTYNSGTADVSVYVEGKGE